MKSRICIEGMSPKTKFNLIFLLTVVNGYGENYSTPKCPQKCHCSINNTKASCRNITGGIFPPLPKNTKVLHIYQCIIHNFTERYLSNLTPLKIEKLYLYDNNITYMDKSGFAIFNQLKVLKIRQRKCKSFEQGMLAKAMFGLNSSTIQALSIQHMLNWSKSLDSNLFAGIKESSIKYIKITYTKIHDIEVSVLPNPSGLKKVLLDYNQLRHINLTGLSKIEMLDISGNMITNIRFCLYDLNNLKYLKYRDNILNTFKIPFKCLKNLIILDISENSFRYIHSNVISKLSNLKYLIMSKVGASLSRIQKLAFNSSSLERLELEDFQGFLVNESTLSSETFWFTPNLKILRISRMVMTNCSLNFLKRMFSKLTKLEELYLEHLKFYKIPERFLSYFPSIISFSISGNDITSWDNQDIFWNVSSLEYLYISQSKISVVNSSMLPLTVWHSLKKLDLSSNLFSCSCENLWFMNWIKINKQILVRFNKKSYYKCNSPLGEYGKPLANFQITADDCKSWNTLYLITVILCSFALVFLIVFCVIYRYRWHIKYFIYMLKSNKINCPVTEDQQIYDGFVIYSDEDRNWVHGILLPKLENQENFKLCIHFRDFEVGQFIIDNIVEKMSKSKKVILVLSNNLIKSEWCSLELKLAQKRCLLEGSEFLIILRLEELNRRVNLSILRAIVNSTTYADWHAHSEDNAIFWDQVIRAIGRSTSHRSNVPEHYNGEEETRPLLASGNRGSAYTTMQGT